RTMTHNTPLVCISSRPSRTTPLPYPLFFFYSYGPPRDLHSFPTRRSSDLVPIALPRPRDQIATKALPEFVDLRAHVQRRSTNSRSEEHTSELQSRSDLVCRLLLEKKKKTNNDHLDKNQDDNKQTQRQSVCN